MADNPFADQVNALNGLNLVNGALGRINAYIDLSASDLDTITATGSYAPPPFYYPGTVTIDNLHYIPGYISENGEHVLPSFGRVIFSGIYSSTTMYVIGFNSDGNPILSRDQYSIEAITERYGSVFVLNQNGRAYDLTYPLTFETNPAAICFAEGTRIDTVNGPVAVEDLTAGDMVRTASGAVRPVKWIGMQIANPGVHRRPAQLNPVLVRAHAFGPNVPSRDVRLSPGHAVFVDGVLVPVGYLINGATIVQIQVETIRYYHVELDSHDVLLAEGLPCESYFDDGNRLTFINSGDFTQLHGRLDPQNWENACAPMVAAGPQLIDIRNRLHAIAEHLGWQKSEEPELCILVGDTRISPLHRADNRYWFSVPATEAFTLRSGKAVLAHMMPALSDTRTLGVAVAELRIDGVAVALDDPAFGAGFYAAEHHEASSWRWTDGDATLAYSLAGPAMLEVQLAMVAPSWRAAAPQLRIVA